MSAQREFSDGEVVPGTRYRVVSLIGSGGMGSVYEVEHEELGKRFVLKALLRSLTNRDDLVHRLRNEWRALGRLEHPNIVSVTDAGVATTGVPFYVMERLQGETLSARLRREYRLAVGDALGIAADVLEGLSAAHRIGIVHRGVKPPNLFLVAGGGAKLLDFGIAKMLDPKASQITGRGVAIGTPRYMAPEQATGGTVDARTDLYATGLILFEMIAGAGPFDAARDANELFLAHLAKDAPPVSSAAPRVPRELDPLLGRLLAKKPEDRPADASAVAAELRALRARLVLPPSPAPAPAGPDDRTVPGGPFDTLESAHTVPSDGQGARAAHLLHDATTHTGLGPATSEASARPEGAAPRTLADAAPPSASGETARSGETLRLEALEPSLAPEPVTRTAAPVPSGETPPPVEPLPRSAPPPSRSRWVALSLLAGAGAVTAFVVVRSLPRPSVASAAGSPALAPSAEQPHAASAEEAPAVSAPARAIPPASAMPPAPGGAEPMASSNVLPAVPTVPAPVAGPRRPSPARKIENGRGTPGVAHATRDLLPASGL